ncbi:hypothetical protein R5W24_001468 [Gemmata sp. JC717]|uniref:hypothetical protein n=1 Tax=Gemmata algarum TaxID=2975278 RepID=UPI0021BB46B2|nr:hypothetical protein [Gemmata algarum]MDY3552386.1 hypothetical protein [Gemmata algarum]
MSTSIAVLCEGPTDPPTICRLADRIIVAGVDWIDADEIETHRHYRGFRPADPFMTWFEIDELAKQYNVKSRGHFDGLPLHGDGHNTRKALILLTLHAPAETPVDAVIIFRDGDKEYDNRRAAITQVRDSLPLGIPVVIGVANRMRECWVLNGFDPADDERGLFAAECARVQFDPRTRAHDLSAADESEDRSPKRVLRSLCAGDSEREHRCIQNTALALLRTRGEATGLRQFLEELEARLTAAFR